PRQPRCDPVAVLLAGDAADPVRLLPRRRVQHEGRLTAVGPRGQPANRTDSIGPENAVRAKLAGRQRPALIRASDTSGRAANSLISVSSPERLGDPGGV